MAVDRPTFSESWYRVAALRPRLRSTLQTYRQHYRGDMWHVVRDPGNNQFFRLNAAAYHFVGLLDGKRSVEQVWDICNNELGDEAPTQGEAIQLLGQLYTSNLLATELPADAAGMFDRYKKRVRREVGSYFKNLLFIRIPLIDPDQFLDRWVGLFGLAFTWLGFGVWLALLAVAFNFLSDKWAELFAAGGAQQILSGDNLIFLYLSFGLIKAVHEFGHGFACKKYGRDAQSGGEVHTMGIMFLVLMPVPYVDASSSWALRNKWQRIIIAMGGMYVELAIAAVAAIVWAQTQPGTLVNAICFNIMFVASVSTVLFNGNPLLRYDAYYILSDLLEIPNLSQRSKDYIYYLVKRYAYKVRKPRNPAHTTGERFWLTGYGIASSIYRVFICTAILMFIADKLLVLGALLAIGAVVTWVIMPIGKWINYLVTSPELVRTRQRAVAVTVSALVAVFVTIGGINFEEHARAEAIVQPKREQFVYMPDDGFINHVLPSNIEVDPDGDPVVIVRNIVLETRLKTRQAELNELLVRDGKALADQNPAMRVAIASQIGAAKDDVADLRNRVARLAIHAPIKGVWYAPQLDKRIGAFVRKGEPLGQVLDISELHLQAVASNEVGGRIKITTAEDLAVEIRAKGAPDISFFGRVTHVAPAATSNLPDPSMAIHSGGAIATKQDDRSGTQTTEHIFKVRIEYFDEKLDDDRVTLPDVRVKQRMVVRFNLGESPLIFQWWRQLRQLVQRRFTGML